MRYLKSFVELEDIKLSRIMNMLCLNLNVATTVATTNRIYKDLSNDEYFPLI